MTEGPDADGTDADGTEEDGTPPGDATETTREEDREQSAAGTTTGTTVARDQSSSTDADVSDADGTDDGVSEGEVTDADATDAAAADQPDESRTLPVFETPAEAEAGAGPAEGVTEAVDSDLPADVRKYDKFQKIDGGTYDRANEFLRDRTYITAREWAIARLCADFRTETGVEMTKIGENLPELVPFMTDTYTPQAVNQARSSFEGKVRKSGATFLYGAMCDFFTAQELDDVMYEATEVAKFLLEVEGVELSVDDELEAEDRISEVMREVREHSAALRHDEMTCPECGHEMNADE